MARAALIARRIAAGIALLALGGGAWWPILASWGGPARMAWTTAVSVCAAVLFARWRARRCVDPIVPTLTVTAMMIASLLTSPPITRMSEATSIVLGLYVLTGWLPRQWVALSHAYLWTVLMAMPIAVECCTPWSRRAMAWSTMGACVCLIVSRTIELYHERRGSLR